METKNTPEELFGTGELLPIRKWLHVWTEAERAMRLGIKSPCAGSPDNGEGESPANRAEETVKQRICSSVDAPNQRPDVVLRK